MSRRAPMLSVEEVKMGNTINKVTTFTMRNGTPASGRVDATPSRTVEADDTFARVGNTIVKAELLFNPFTAPFAAVSLLSGCKSYKEADSGTECAASLRRSFKPVVKSVTNTIDVPVRACVGLVARGLSECNERANAAAAADCKAADGADDYASCGDNDAGDAAFASCVDDKRISLGNYQDAEDIGDCRTLAPGETASIGARANSVQLGNGNRVFSVPVTQTAAIGARYAMRDSDWVFEDSAEVPSLSYCPGEDPDAVDLADQDLDAEVGDLRIGYGYPADE